MRYLVSASLVIAGLIHLLPLAGVLSAARLSALYGITVTEPNLEILMRHRAVLFGLLGLFLCYAAFRPPYQVVALAAGLCSVVSFLLLAWAVGGYNAQLSKVFAVDVAALLVLVVGAGALLRSRLAD
ncbi:phosphopantetheine adenylyltransferase [Variovorax sp. ZT5P49]|uniref:phosphopantetheine adenylyltransferase n=1 Tax=Variovorax sp. ZT5P49 TaxID=3443733 RepID=UPI003F471E76